MKPERSAPLVLAADDDPDILELVVGRLERDGYRVLAARDGVEALELAREHEPDLLVLDIAMPRLSGLEVSQAVRDTMAAPPPVIFLTAHAQTDSRVAGLDSGAVDYVVKPFAAAELLARVRAALRSREAQERMLEEAARDRLTGTLVRGALDERGAALVALAARYGRPLACALLDLDRFKEINDAFGHAAGDAVLRQVGAVLRDATRISDVTGRYGGDEFVLLLPETGLEGAQRVVDKVLSALADQVVTVREGETIGIGASAGVAAWEEGMQGIGDLYAAADAALYRAKRLGRGKADAASSEAA